MAEAAATAPQTGAAIPADVRRYRTYALVILTLANISNFTDRSIIAILVEPIKKELLVSDTAMGFLSGFAFAIFYATLGIPIAMLADRHSRKNIIAVAIGVWSVMTAACGAAGNYVQLLLARIGVGVGEAGASPPAHSMLSDMYAPDERARALSVYALGIYIGSTLGFLIGAYVNAKWGWRTAFFVVGFPGLFLALLVWLTVPEPPRGLADGKLRAQQTPRSWAETMATLKAAFAFLWQSKTCRHVIAGITLVSFVGYGGTIFVASFLERTHHISGLTVGLILGPIVGTLGSLGAILGGTLADRLGKRDRRWSAWIISLAKFLAFPFVIGFYLIDDFNIALWVYLPSAILGAFYLGPSLAIIQSTAPIEMRATASAITLFVINLIGLGLGPLFVGFLSDTLKPAFADDSLRYALMVTTALNLWAAVHYYLAGKAYAAEA